MLHLCSESDEYWTRAFYSGAWARSLMKSAPSCANSDVCLQTTACRKGQDWCSNIHLQVLHTLRYRGITVGGSVTIFIQNIEILLEFKRLSNLSCTHQWLSLFHWTRCGWETMKAPRSATTARSWNAQAHPESIYLWLPVINVLTLKRIKPLPVVQRPIMSVQTVVTVVWTH